MGGCQNYGPFLGPHYNTAPTSYLGHRKRDHNFDNHPHESHEASSWVPRSDPEFDEPDPQKRHKFSTFSHCHTDLEDKSGVRDMLEHSVIRIVRKYW